MGQRTIRIWGTVGVATVLVMGAVFVSRAPIARQMHRWQLLPQSETFTELYFSRPTHLPTTYAPHTMQHISFTVRNREARAVQYHYEVHAEAGAATPLAAGDFTVVAGEAHTQTVDVQLPDIGQKAQVVVALPNQHQSIRYWVTKKAVL